MCEYAWHHPYSHRSSRALLFLFPLHAGGIDITAARAANSMRSSISTEAGHCAKCFGARLFSKMSATKTTCDTSLASLADLATTNIA